MYFVENFEKQTTENSVHRAVKKPSTFKSSTDEEISRRRIILLEKEIEAAEWKITAENHNTL